MRRALATRDMVRATAVSALVLGLGAGCSGVRYTEAFTPQGEFSSIRLLVDQGNIELSAGDTVWVERTVRAAEGTLSLSHEVVDGVLIMEARCTTPIPCPVDTVLQAPAGMPVSVELGAGELWAGGLADLDLQVGEGVVEVDLDGSLRAQVAQGALRAHLAGGSLADLAVGSGDLELRLDPVDWSLDLSAEEVELRGLSDIEGAKGQVRAMAPGGRILVGTGGEIASR